uniref:uncharacterized protein LOC120336520 n=1 Tax=Styela clava TaxID=7725 RepID=UPI001939F700|nr:uncharacterized protein LOC120336520 [Styela clava]
MTYIEIDKNFANDGTYNICPEIFGESYTGCQSAHGGPGFCAGEGGYQTDITGSPTIEDPRVTICCNPHYDSTTVYTNASAFSEYLNGKEIEVLNTIGCDFTTGEKQFITLTKFKRMRIKNMNDKTQLDPSDLLRVNDQNTEDWVKSLSLDGATLGKSEFNIETDVFKTQKTEVVKAFSFVKNDGTGDMVTVAYTDI